MWAPVARFFGLVNELGIMWTRLCGTSTRSLLTKRLHISSKQPDNLELVFTDGSKSKVGSSGGSFINTQSFITSGLETTAQPAECQVQKRTILRQTY